MQRLCERPGCGAASDASYGIDRMNLVVWVDRADIAERETAGRLCRRHANALMVPRGWTLDDRRDPVPKLFKVREPDDDQVAPKPGRRARPAPREQRQKPDTPSLFESIRREVETVEVASGAQGGVDPDETQAMPWAPRLGRSSGRDDTRPQGRLLGRAFGDTPVEDE